MGLKYVMMITGVMVSSVLPSQMVRTPEAARINQVFSCSKWHKDALVATALAPAIGHVKNFAAGIYGEKRYLLDELNHYMLALILPAGQGSFAGIARYFGNTNHNSAQLGLAYARRIGAVATGVQFNYLSTATRALAKTATASMEMGIAFPVAKGLSMMVHLNNPPLLPGNKQEWLPSVYTMVLGYDVADKFYTGIVLEKEETQPFSVMAGFQYKWHRKLFTRAGIYSINSAFHLATGFQYRNLSILAAMVYHPQLGPTPGVAILYDPSSTQ